MVKQCIALSTDMTQTVLLVYTTLAKLAKNYIAFQLLQQLNRTSRCYLQTFSYLQIPVERVINSEQNPIFYIYPRTIIFFSKVYIN